MESFGEEGGLSIISELIENGGEEKEEERVVVQNLSKLGYHQLFYQKDRQLLVEDLGGWERSFTLKQYYDLKERHEKAIKKFKSTHIMEEMDGIKKRRRANSIDTEATGAFYLNNWLSHEEYPCEKAPPEEKTANLFYELLLLRWNKALELISSFQMTPEVTSLQYIIMCFRAISSLLTDQDKFLTEHFIGRATHEIKFKQAQEIVGGLGTFVNVLQQDSKTKFWQIRSLPKRIDCLKINLDFLVRFTSNYKIRTEDCYLQLCFLFLGNKYNQQSMHLNLPEQKDYYHLLLNLDLKLSDRLNFATKLLNEKKRKDFCNELEESLCSFPRLDNILFYTANPTSKNKEQKIEKIVKAYLDKYGDLETIAYLAHEFTFLRKYYSQFKQALQLASEHKELERLETYKLHGEKEGFKDLEIKKSTRRVTSFFDVIHPNEEKISDWRLPSQALRVCEICCKKLAKDENFLECGKCHHGGHIPHLLKWFDEYENCPHIGCPCLCN